MNTGTNESQQAAAKAAAQPTPLTPKEADPTIGAAVLVSYYDGKHVLRNVAAHVLALSPSSVAGLPSLTVAFPSIPADPLKLSSPRWYEAFERRCGVLHHTHPDALAGKVMIVWGHATDETTFPALIKPEGSAENPIFERHILEDARPDIAQVAAIQSGKAPEGSSAPALTSEAIAGITGLAQEEQASADPLAGQKRPISPSSQEQSSIPDHATLNTATQGDAKAPSAADLDAHAQEQQAAEATSTK